MDSSRVSDHLGPVPRHAHPLAGLGFPHNRPSGLPRHVAVIMDGNGRWAQQRGLPRLAGHAAGALRAKELVQTCGELGVEVLTLYSFSVENWSRPPEEVDGLMELAVAQLAAEREALAVQGVRFRHLGSRAGLPAAVLEQLDATALATAGCQGLTLCLAMNYGARQEIVDAMRVLAQRAARGDLTPEDIDQELVGSALQTAGLPDPDLVIRSAGEHRLSNFLLWQVSYAELHVTELLWPDFDRTAFECALEDYAGRTRKWGSVAAPESA